MSKISIVIDQDYLSNSTMLSLKNFTQQSISQINEHIRNSAPVFNALLFYNNHRETADTLLKIITVLQKEKIKFSIYELEEDELFDKEIHARHDISVQTLENILDVENYE